MDVDTEVEPTLLEMAKRIAVMQADLLPALRQLDEDTVLSFYSVDEQARLYLSAAFTLALSLYSLDKITHRQVTATGSGGGTAAPRLTGAGTRGGNHANSNSSSVPSNTDTQLVLKIERVTEYIKKLQELATLERNKKLAATVPAGDAEGAKADEGEKVEKAMPGKKRPRHDTTAASAAEASEASDVATSKKAKTEKAEGEKTEAVEDEYGDAQMFSVVSRVAGETGTLVSRLLKQVMTSKTE